MITEDFVSYEVAKLLKEKEFDELCIFKYNSEGVRMKAGVAIDEWQNSELDDDECSCVSHQMAMKWLREVHNIHIGINPISGKGYNATIYDVADFDDYGIISDTESFFHVEQACEVAIKYCLENLI